jgi:cytochrome c-type biogenesis protein CcmE
LKNSHIIGLLAIVVLLAIIIVTLYDTDTYGNFRIARKNKELSYQIIGKLDKSNVVVFDSTAKDMRLEFYMIDENNDTAKVIYYGDKPRDFDKLEQVVVTGIMKESYFEATDLLLKCPSKYTKKKTDEQHYKAVK